VFGVACVWVITSYDFYQFYGVFFLFLTSILGNMASIKKIEKNYKFFVLIKLKYYNMKKVEITNNYSKAYI
jgi:TctA family transporter